MLNERTRIDVAGRRSFTFSRRLSDAATETHGDAGIRALQTRQPLVDHQKIR
jgi:hypothetical protein